MAAEPPPTVRFGIIGCANIARKVSRAILLSPNSAIVANRQPLSGESLRVRQGQQFPGIGQGVRVVRRRSGRPGGGRRLHSAADEPPPPLGGVGGSEEEARAAGEAGGAECWRAG
ncbi:uncharacterized oxidoreductase at4g09670 [Phtheirospermum japonicum]|uniref:Uncharacterized oxidoreductase at4g09670 n=1 Tax=Phtheirospermum japonicum TaxID=374723 RepID=A0A830D7A5_9LAMI|nr:uncharacterized oxidoreductase at4g09670 [Phtheirospermum japonicum]